MALKWYIVHVYSGFESKVKAALEERVGLSSNPDKFGEVLVPTEEVVELVKGKRRTSARKFYPGYLLVRMELDDETWHIVNDTAKVTGFLGGNSNSTTGDFSFGIVGLYVENGEIVKPVNEMNISGNMQEFWNCLVEVGNDPYPYSSWRIPSLYFKDIHFSGI